MSVSCECCVLSGGVFCDGLIPHPEERYRHDFRYIVTERKMCVLIFSGTFFMKYFS
jgi:hypothetical protein